MCIRNNIAHRTHETTTANRERDAQENTACTPVTRHYNGRSRVHRSREHCLHTGLTTLQLPLENAPLKRTLLAHWSHDTTIAARECTDQEKTTYTNVSPYDTPSSLTNTSETTDHEPTKKPASNCHRTQPTQEQINRASK